MSFFVTSDEAMRTAACTSCARWRVDGRAAVPTDTEPNCPTSDSCRSRCLRTGTSPSSSLLLLPEFFNIQLNRSILILNLSKFYNDHNQVNIFYIESHNSPKNKSTAVQLIIHLLELDFRWLPTAARGSSYPAPIFPIPTCNRSRSLYI